MRIGNEIFPGHSLLQEHSFTELHPFETPAGPNFAGSPPPLQAFLLPFTVT